MTAPVLVTQAQFAILQGWNRSTVTRLKQAGRLVMDADGKRVDVEASRARIAATGGMRDDVADRHADARGATGQGSQGATNFNGSSRLDAQIRKLIADADLAEMTVKEQRGDLIRKDDVITALKFFAAAICVQLDSAPDKICPVVTPVTDFAENYAFLREQFNAIRASVAYEMAQFEKEHS